MDKTANCIDATSLQTMSSSTLFTPSSEVDKGAKKRESRVRFDDEEASQHEQPHPKTSPHWQSLSHDLENDKYWEKIEDLEDQLRLDLSLEQSSSNKKKGFLVALWSCIAGYCEALSTSKQPQRRYPIFPVPISALERLVREEYISNMLDSLGGLSIDIDDVAKDHRERVRRISNSIWQKAIPKPNVRDELHANSLYTCLRGSIERKSLDCFGSAICVISALWILEESSSSSKSSTMTTASSQLALSEDHAYEMHRITTTTNSGEQGTCIVGTCEIAIPGNTKLAQSKRGRDISETYKNSPTMTPECSWLYMAKNPVICNSLSMVLVAVFGNLNPTIEKKSSTTLSSGQLYDFKRDLLWVLHDQEAMKNFPFGLMELGDCEEHRGSKRSEEWVTIPEIPEPILMNEKLFWDAIEVNQRMYNESQTYPYFCT